MSELAKSLIREAKKTGATSLDLGNCGLTKWPEELFELTHLEKLTVSNRVLNYEKRKWIKSKNKGRKNNLRVLPLGIKKLSKLTVLQAGEFQIEDISILAELKQLQSLDLSSNQIEDISILAELKQLQSLYLSSNQIEDISILAELKQLQSLDLRYNQIEDISILAELKQLQSLDLSSIKQIKDFSILAELKQLQSLDLSSNQIEDISILAELKQLQSLDLSSNQIEDISILAELKQLQSLDLSSNQIEDISILAELKQLQSLYLSSNKQIKDFSILAELKQLQSLYLSSNQIEDISILAELKQLQSLDLRYNQIEDISILAELKQLQSLDLSSIKQIKDFSILAELKQLQSLYLRSNQIEDISILAELKQLQSLYLSSNQIEDISILAELKQLQSLYLSSNQIEDISILAELKQLQSLDLRDNQIEDISILAELKQLQSLDLRYNQIEDISILAELKQLQSLYLSSIKQIKDFSILAELKQLQSLDLSYNQIEDISILAELKQLQSLYLSSNQIEDISILAELKQLQSLYLSSNQIEDISILAELKQLQSLYLRSNQIEDISILAELKQLQSLDLSSNQISDISPLIPLIKRGIPISLKQHETHQKINLFNNPLQLPPKEVVSKGNSAILSFFEDLAESENDSLYEAKILFVGEGGVGKTSLIKRLKNREAPLPAPNDRTRGISISKLNFSYKEDRDFCMNMWDFGGQDIYHATHRFFLTRRSLYVLLTETRRQDDNFDYWIPNIRLFGDKSPIIVTKNMFKGHQRQVDLSEFRKSEDFNIVENVIDINLLDNTGLENLQKTIKHHVTNLPHVGDKVPKTWVQVREELGKLAQNTPYISVQKFLEICEKEGIKKEDRALTLGGYLHDLGIVLWYDTIPGLKDKVILKPEWATKAVYLIIDDEKIQQNQGNFNLEDIKRLWCTKDYIRMHQELILLMKAFKLCFQKGDREQYLIPAMLPIEPLNPLNWNKENNLTLQFDYTFMPKGIANQLSARLHRYLKGEEYVWAKGLWLEDQKTEAFVEENWLNKKIEIRIKGLNPSGFMGVLLKEFEEIHETYPGIEVIKLVPCNCTLCLSQAQPELFHYSKLREKISTGKRQYYCNRGDEFIDIQELLFRVGINIPSKNIHSGGMGAIHGRGDRDYGPGSLNPLKSSRLKTNILFLAASPSGDGRQRMTEEHREVNESLKRAKKRDQFNFVPSFATTRRNISRAILDERPRIVHFSGSGAANEGIQIEDSKGNFKPLSTDALEGLFELFEEEVECVILNACYSENQARAIADHIPYVIGMQDTIGDKGAIEFAIGFYDAIGNGRDIPFAFKFAKEGMNLEGLAESSIPILLQKKD